MQNKIKLSSGLASLILVATLFAGWQVVLLVMLLMFLFCEVEENVKNVASKVLTFYVGFTLVSMAWELIISGINLVFGSLDQIVAIINVYRDPLDLITLAKFTTPFVTVIAVVDSIFNYLLTFVKFGFIISLLTGKAIHNNPVSSKINEYMTKAINYISSMDSVGTNAQYAPNNNVVNNVQQPTNNVPPQNGVPPQSNVVNQ